MNEEKYKDGNMLLPNGKYYTLDERISKLNNNVVICGTSGSSKTRNFIIPNLLEGVGSYIITDPKGTLYKLYGDYMKKRGYKVIRLSFIHPEQSIHYNPLEYIKNTQDIQKLTHSLINADKQSSNVNDPFWNEMSNFLINSIIGYLFEVKESHPELYNIPTIMELLRNCGRPDMTNKKSQYGELLYIYSKAHPDSWAIKQFQNLSQCPNKTYDTIVGNSLSKFSIYDTEELGEMLKYDEINFTSIGEEKTILFCEISDTDTSMQRLINTFFTQAFNQLCLSADYNIDNRLKIPVRFFMDDFPTIHIDNFEVMISNIRSRKISAAIVIQSLAQLTSNYGEAANTILDNCDTFIFTGTNSPDTANLISLRCNKTLDTILHMPINHSWIFRRGTLPELCENYNLEDYIKENHKNLL